MNILYAVIGLVIATGVGIGAAVYIQREYDAGRFDQADTACGLIITLLACVLIFMLWPVLAIGYPIFRFITRKRDPHA